MIAGKMERKKLNEKAEARADIDPFFSADQKNTVTSYNGIPSKPGSTNNLERLIDFNTIRFSRNRVIALSLKVVMPCYDMAFRLISKLLI